MSSWPRNSLSQSVGFRCASDPIEMSQLWSTNAGRAGKGANIIKVGLVSDAKLYRVINLGDNSVYDLSVYVYDDTAGNRGGKINAEIAQLYYNGSAIPTVYTDDENGWWRLSGTLVAANEQREYGILISTEKTIKIDNVVLKNKWRTNNYFE